FNGKTKWQKDLEGEVLDELADVSLMIKQMVFIFGDYAEIEQKKLSRLEHRLTKGKWEVRDK
ncbi:MAG: hypothetical protein ACTSX1_10195, partial [Candidatus Heimdallarchaeaceae archaeon]